jgi:hypothetical protein
MFLFDTNPTAYHQVLANNGLEILLVLPLFIGIALGGWLFYILFQKIREVMLGSWCRAIMPGIAVFNAIMIVRLFMDLASISGRIFKAVRGGK